MPMPSYMRRYLVRLSSFMVGYAIILIGGLYLARTGAPISIRVFLAFATAAMICGVFWAIFRLLGECDDEYQRLLFVKQVLLATAATLVITTGWEFLRVYEVVAEGPRWIGVIWFAMIGIAGPIARWRA